HLGELGLGRLAGGGQRVVDAQELVDAIHAPMVAPRPVGQAVVSTSRPTGAGAAAIGALSSAFASWCRKVVRRETRSVPAEAVRAAGCSASRRPAKASASGFEAGAAGVVGVAGALGTLGAVGVV